jgi:hypothetical protein
MGKGRQGRQKKRRKANKQGQRTTEELDLAKEKEMERAEAERQAKHSRKYLAARAGSDPPPILGEPDSLVPAPLKPKPHLRSGAMALREPELEDAFFGREPKINIKVDPPT